MKQISNFIWCDDFITELHIENRILPNPYYDYPFLYIKNFIPESFCHKVVDYAKKANDIEKAMVKNRLLGVVDPDVDEEIRKTLIHRLSDPLVEEYNSIFLIHQKRIEDFFNIALTTSTQVQALEYTKGAFYIKHSDDSNEIINADGDTVGFVQVAPQRKMTSVLFATSHTEQIRDGYEFSGGELVFNYLYDADGRQVTLRPQAGDMILFPSNPVYSHEVLPVDDGYRMTLVQWHNGIISGM